MIKESNLIANRTQKKVSLKFVNFRINRYLCNVFFIVLDLRLTKVGVQRDSIFFAFSPRQAYKRMRLLAYSKRTKEVPTNIWKRRNAGNHG